jgi:hypothetical protein
MNPAISADRVEIFQGQFNEATDERGNEYNDGDGDVVARGINGFIEVNGKLPALVEEMGYQISKGKRVGIRDKYP